MNSVNLDIQVLIDELQDTINQNKIIQDVSFFEKGYCRGTIDTASIIIGKLTDILNASAGIYPESESRDIQE